MKTEYVYLDAQGEKTDIHNAKVVVIQKFNNAGILVEATTTEIKKMPPNTSANTGQGSYTGKTSNPASPNYTSGKENKTWICPNDETENTGDHCIICGAPRPQKNNKKILIAIISIVLVFAAIVVILVAANSQKLPGFYRSESGTFSISLEKDGSCYWYQDSIRFSGTYTESDSSITISMKGIGSYSDTIFTATLEDGNLRINGGVVHSELFIRGEKDEEILKLDQNDGEKNTPVHPDKTGSQWKIVPGDQGIKKVATGEYHAVVLKNDGTVFVIGNTEHGGGSIVEEWTNIVDIDTSLDITVGLRTDKTICIARNNVSVIPENVTGIIDVAAGDGFCACLTEDGTVVVDGYDTRELGVETWTDVASIYTTNYNLFGLKTDGTVVATGENSFGQCNIDQWADIIDIAVNERHILGLKADGTVVAAGENIDGACDVSGWTDIVAIDAGLFFSAGIQQDGGLVVAGSPYIAYDSTQRKDITDIAAGKWELAVLHDDGKLSLTSSGNYSDFAAWNNIDQIYAGNDYIAAITEDGSLKIDAGNDIQRKHFADWLDAEQNRTSNHDTTKPAEKTETLPKKNTNHIALLSGHWEEAFVKDGKNQMNIHILVFEQKLEQCEQMTITFNVTMKAGARCKEWQLWGRIDGKLQKLEKVYLPDGTGIGEHTLTFDTPTSLDAIALTPTANGGYSWSLGLYVEDIWLAE